MSKRIETTHRPSAPKAARLPTHGQSDREEITTGVTAAPTIAAVGAKMVSTPSSGEWRSHTTKTTTRGTHARIDNGALKRESLVDVARTALDARDDAKLKSTMNELHGTLYQAMQAAMTSTAFAMETQNALRSAQDELAQLKTKAAERERYALAQIPGEGKQYAYAAQPTQTGKNEPPHYLCQPCYDKGVKSVLQMTESEIGSLYTCNCCKTTLYI